MVRYSKVLEQEIGYVRFSFVHEGIMISNPHLSECGRFEVDPVQYYGADIDEDNAVTVFFFEEETMITAYAFLNILANI